MKTARQTNGIPKGLVRRKGDRSIGKQKAQLQFTNWVKKNMPGVYIETMKQMNTDQSLLGSTDWISNVANAVSNVGQGFLQLKSQRDILAMQMERAKAGLPPLEPEYIEAKMNVTVEPAITDETAAQLTTIASQTVGETIRKYAPIGLGLAFLFWYMTNKKKGRR